MTKSHAKFRDINLIFFYSHGALNRSDIVPIISICMITNNVKLIKIANL